MLFLIIDSHANLLEIMTTMTVLLPSTQTLDTKYLHKVVSVNPDHNVIEQTSQSGLVLTNLSTLVCFLHPDGLQC